MARRNGSVHVATTRRTYKDKVYETHLLRRSYRDKNNKVQHQTLGNISHLPPDLIDVIRRRLNGEPLADSPFEIVRSLPHGHVVAVLGTMQKLGIENLLASRPSRERSLVLAMIAMRILAPTSKLATARSLQEATATTSLSLELGIDDLDEKELYGALDWLNKAKNRLENKLARRHLTDGTLILYDVSGSYYTGRQSSLVKFGHPRDKQKGLPQIVYGLLCNAEGCPVAVHVFPGNTADPNTLGTQIQKIRKRFGITRVVMVGDRGMLTAKRIDEELRDVEGLDWVTALRADSIKKLMKQGVIQRSFFDEHKLAEVTSEDYPGERLIVCRNPLLADERARKRQELLAATEKKLDEIVEATKRVQRPLRGKAKIGVRVGKVINKHKVGKHFVLDIADESFRYHRNEEKITEEAALDGLYVIRTSVKAEVLDSENTVRAYKDLSKVERAFRCLKTVDLKVRPIFHWLDGRIEAHVFLCMLAYYVEWHMRQQLAPILFEDHQRAEAEPLRESIVDPAPRSPAATQKDRTKRTEEGEPVHSFQTLLKDLGTLAKNRVRMPGAEPDFYVLTTATSLQQRALDLLDASL